MTDIKQVLLTRLDDRRVLGVSMKGVQLLRLDRHGGLAPGNKSFKLQGSLDRARELGVRRLVSFGGAWSNHLHALAAVGNQQGFATVGIVRGGPGNGECAALTDARDWGMTLVHVSREEYRRRNDTHYLDQVAQQFAPCLVIPEGGASAEGARGCMEIGEMVRRLAPGARRVVLPVGTGTTLAGVAAGLGVKCAVVGVSALKAAVDLEGRLEQALAACKVDAPANWQILHDEHCGGFARVSAGLREFILAFEEAHQVPLEPVYTGKMMFAIHRRLASGEWEASDSLVAVHTGGLQGRRGFDF
jgi:1-aminocyclopropane-1-carboxylate deaminase